MASTFASAPLLFISLWKIYSTSLTHSFKRRWEYYLACGISVRHTWDNEWVHFLFGWHIENSIFSYYCENIGEQWRNISPKTGSSLVPSPLSRQSLEIRLYLPFCQYLSALRSTPTQHLLFFVVYVSLCVSKGPQQTDAQACLKISRHHHPTNTCFLLSPCPEQHLGLSKNKGFRTWARCSKWVKSLWYL